MGNVWRVWVGIFKRWQRSYDLVIIALSIRVLALPKYKLQVPPTTIDINLPLVFYYTTSLILHKILTKTGTKKTIWVHKTTYTKRCNNLPTKSTTPRSTLPLRFKPDLDVPSAGWRHLAVQWSPEKSPKQTDGPRWRCLNQTIVNRDCEGWLYLIPTMW